MKSCKKKSRYSHAIDRVIREAQFQWQKYLSSLTFLCLICITLVCAFGSSHGQTKMFSYYSKYLTTKSFFECLSFHFMIFYLFRNLHLNQWMEIPLETEKSSVRISCSLPCSHGDVGADLQRSDSSDEAGSEVAGWASCPGANCIQNRRITFLITLVLLIVHLAVITVFL